MPAAEIDPGVLILHAWYGALYPRRLAVSCWDSWGQT
jgi:hypothetical protein